MNASTTALPDGIFIENMTTTWGPGWWDATPYRWVDVETDDSFGTPYATEAEAIAQYHAGGAA